MDNKQHVFIIGAKSLGAYGGFETFVNKLTEYHQGDERIKYHIACKANGSGSYIPNDIKITTDNHFEYHNADCFLIKVPDKIGAAQSIFYDCFALAQTIKIIKAQKIENAIVYILACRIGPFFKKYVKTIHKLGGKIFINPDGHEWLREKWPLPVKKYWKKSENLMVRQADKVICDSVNIEKYIKETYGKKIKTAYVAYGSDIKESSDVVEEEYQEWLTKNNIKEGDYYLSVSRFVPENNYETMLREFMNCKSEKDFVLITNINYSFTAKLIRATNYNNDKRIKFTGTVYNQELLKRIRKSAYANLHGHEVGGTNPSLIEALNFTNVNLLLDVGFNEEVALDSALYWNKEKGNLSSLIDKVDLMSEEARTKLGQKAKERVRTAYSWEYICSRYAEEFLR